ncbi:MAG TPA: hypothetical protein VIJ95_00295 [Hanamia sp.]
MRKTKPHLKREITFSLLMKRYARRLVHKEADASKIVQHVLEDESIPYSKMPRHTPQAGIKVRCA